MNAPVLASPKSPVAPAPAPGPRPDESLRALPGRKRGVLVRHAPPACVLIHLQSGNHYVVEGTARRIFDLCDGFRDLAEIVSITLAGPTTDPAQDERHIKDFLVSMVREGLLDIQLAETASGDHTAAASADPAAAPEIRGAPIVFAPPALRVLGRLDEARRTLYAELSGDEPVPSSRAGILAADEAPSGEPGRSLFETVRLSAAPRRHES